MTYKELADLICPNYISIDELHRRYPKRKTGIVTRFAPSPTGFLHTGSLFTAYINYKLAADNNGIFYLRIEDTDQAREVKGSIDTLQQQLLQFKIVYHNDPIYAPYIQSERKLIYDSVLHCLIEQGRAYPCFCSKDELEDLRSFQAKNNLKIGYYQEFAKCRELSLEEMRKKIDANIPYVVRFKSLGEAYKYEDLLRSNLRLEPNIHDIVLRKSDGLPTYHFAHCCDDHFMGTTHVIRGEEWLASLPIHYELFAACGFDTPKYLHLPTIMKEDEGKRRKLSKRKDKEASVTYLLEQGYPKMAIIEYLLTLANSNFEAWRKANPNQDLSEFKLSINNFSLDGALFDLAKLNNISKEWIANCDFHILIEDIIDYAKEFDKDLLTLIEEDNCKFNSIMQIGRNAINPRKEYVKYTEILPKIAFFYDDYFKQMLIEPYDYSSTIITEVTNSFINIDANLSEEEWLNQLKEQAYSLGFAKNKKEKEQLGLAYLFSDYMSIIRLAICKSKSSPNLYDVIHILGTDTVKKRINDFVVRNK